MSADVRDPNNPIDKKVSPEIVTCFFVFCFFLWLRLWARLLGRATLSSEGKIFSLIQNKQEWPNDATRPHGGSIIQNMCRYYLNRLLCFSWIWKPWLDLMLHKGPRFIRVVCLTYFCGSFATLLSNYLFYCLCVTVFVFPVILWFSNLTGRLFVH